MCTNQDNMILRRLNLFVKVNVKLVAVIVKSCVIILLLDEVFIYNF